MGDAEMDDAPLPPFTSTAGIRHRSRDTRTMSCRLDGHEPNEPSLSEVTHGLQVRAVVHCRRCGSYISSFEGSLHSVLHAASATAMHGLRAVPA